MADFKPLHIVIVGAGLGGLAAAFCFARDGHHVGLYERKPAFEAKGGGIMLRPNATRYLRQWGLEIDFTAIADPSAGTTFFNSHTGDVIMHRPGLTFTIGGNPDWQTVRRETQIVFHEHAKSAGANLHWGVTISDVEEDSDGATATLSTGEKIKADIIFAADGIMSRLRPKIIPDAPQPNVGRTTLHQAEATEQDVLADKEAHDLVTTKDLEVYMSASGGGYVISSFKKSLGRHNAVFGIAEAADADERLWDEHGDIKYVRDYFKDVHPKLKAFLNIVTSCDRWRLAEMPDMPQWVSKGGRLVLLGDSAHAMYPDAAMGFSSIVEDIATLSYLLKEHQNKGIPTLTKIWQEVRIPRVNKLKAWANFNNKLYTKGLTPAKPEIKKQEAAHAEVASNEPESLKPDSNADFRSPAFVMWAYGYDAVGEVKKYMDGVGGQAQF
ncbi:hypothetical protein DOTSEDRAFT_80417 [Dothistroma septosporum NZE10]|uniref:FAD-binding domain-containing protein n=1 Tax=Dothistroma septosporum (strain NZE10 / CBS 128990) TaxID=675120 RepID=M2WL96_DOTSN|nr:hypothetical protein DOTSEDRAFT_80417 [Dothistroma septosporum NZE10]